MAVQEQLIYPTPAGGSDMSEAELMELLHAVDLEYLLHRHGMHATVDWGAALSLGVLPLPRKICSSPHRPGQTNQLRTDVEYLSTGHMRCKAGTDVTHRSCLVCGWAAAFALPKHGSVAHARAGEQQRLGMARLFYHRPRYAILDECTSGVTVDMEERFCSRVKALGCTCITISHRPALVCTQLAQGIEPVVWTRLGPSRACRLRMH